MKKRNNVFLLLLILLLVFIVIFFFLRSGEVVEDVEVGTVGQENFVETYLSAVPARLLSLKDSQLKGAYGYADTSQGIVYISRSGESGASELVAIDTKTGEEHVRYTAGSGLEVTVAGTDGSTIVFYTDTKSATTCEELWSTSHVYYGISKGYVSYSGPAGLLTELESELIADLQSVCLLVL
jgi:hypothetical protein